MPLIECPNCSKQISDSSESCVHCGTPIKICPDCKNIIPNDLNVCQNCGYAMASPKKHINKKPIIIGGAIIIGVVIIAIVILLVINSGTLTKYKKLVSADNVDEANKLYNEQILEDSELSEELIQKENAEMDKIYEDYLAEELSFDDATSMIEKYEKYDASKTYAHSVAQKIKSLKASRDAYTSAVKAEKDGDYKVAISKYKAVIEDDPNYKTAKDKVTSLTVEWRNSLLDEADNYAANKKYTEAIADINELINTFGSDDELTELLNQYSEMKANQYVKVLLTNKTVTPRNSSNWIFNDYVNFVFEITNNSDKDIKGVEGVSIFSDLFGKEIIRVGCDFSGQIIKVGETYIEKDLSFECNQFMDEHMKLFNTDFNDLKFTYEITKIVYSDGSTVVPE